MLMTLTVFKQRYFTLTYIINDLIVTRKLEPVYGLIKFYKFVVRVLRKFLLLKLSVSCLAKF